MTLSVGLRAALLIAAILVAPEHVLANMTRAPELVPASQPIPEKAAYSTARPFWPSSQQMSKVVGRSKTMPV